MKSYPLLGFCSPVKHLKVVVFPAPVTPSKAKHSPYSSPKLTFSTAGLPPKCLFSCYTATVILDLSVSMTLFSSAIMSSSTVRSKVSRFYDFYIEGSSLLLPRHLFRTPYSIKPRMTQYKTMSKIKNNKLGPAISQLRESEF
jgi:hypothetical protein